MSAQPWDGATLRECVGEALEQYDNGIAGISPVCIRKLRAAYDAEAERDDPIASMKAVYSALQRVVTMAEIAGVSFTVTREPLKPLAMGYARPVIDVWLKR